MFPCQSGKSIKQRIRLNEVYFNSKQNYKYKFNENLKKQNKNNKFKSNCNERKEEQKREKEHLTNLFPCGQPFKQW